MPDKETAVGNDVYAFNAALSEINTSNTSRKIVNILVPTQSRHGATLSGYTGDSSMDNIKKYEVTQTTGWSLRGTTLNNYQQSLIVTEDGNLLATTDSLLYSGGENVIAGYVYMENVQAQLNKLYEKNPSSYLGTSYEPVNPEVARIRDAIRGMQEIADYDSAQKS